jgi:hypothetical protein
MKKIILSALVAAAFAISPDSYALIAGDNAGTNNYPGGAWSAGSNGGSGFGAWSLPGGAGTGGSGGFNGSFIGSATNTLSNYIPLFTDGVAFSIYAGGGTPDAAFQDALRPFSSTMSVGDTFSHSIGFSFDNGNKGFDLYSGTGGTGQVFNFNIGSAGYTWTGGGSNAMTPFTPNRTNGVVINFSFTLTPTGFNYSFGSLQDAGLTQSGSVAAAGIGSIKYYISGAGGGDPGNLYFNNLTVVPEPSTYALLALSAAGLAGYAARRRARK